MSPDRERDLDEEIQSHLAIEADENLQRGMTPEEARLAAARKFGNVALAKEFCREARGFAWLDRLRQDLRYALRTFARAPGVTVVAVLSLALGIGATTAIFSVVNALLLRPLPYHDPQQLVSVAVTNRSLNLGVDELPLSIPILRLWQEHATSLQGLAAFMPLSFNLTGTGEPLRVAGARATANLFGIVGVRPALGRTFTVEEEEPGRSDVVVISDTLWKRSFGASPSVLGRKLRLDGQSYTIVGVMPPGFHYPDNGERITLFSGNDRIDLWKPIALDAGERTDLGNFSFQVVGRLKPGIDAQRAQAELAALGEQLTRKAAPAIGTGWEILVHPLPAQVATGVRPAVTVLIGAVSFLLLIACVNVANLLLARASSRGGEMAVRLALGAGPLRLVRQLLTESVLLALAGGAAGIAIAAGALGAFLALAPASIPRLNAIEIDATVLSFCFAVSILTGILFGLAPALEAVRPALNEALQRGAGRATHPGLRRHTRHALVVSEIALSLVLLTGACLLIKSFVLLMRVPSGFRAENVVTMLLPLSSPSYRNLESRVLFMRALIARLESQAGVQAAGAIDMLPLTGENNISDVGIEGVAPSDPSAVPIAEFRGITPAYFTAMGIALHAGRAFHENEGTPVAIISRTAARRFWPGVADPIGRRFTRGHDGTTYLTVIGVVDDVRSSGLDVPPRPQIYQPFTHYNHPEMTIAVRTVSNPSLQIAAIRQEVRKLDKDVPAMNVRVMKEVVARSVSGRKFQMLLVVLFAGLALVLAVIGIYGVVSYSVAQRKHEIGLRMALGAVRRDALALVLREGMALAAAGVALGTAAAFVVTPVLRRFLYGISATDPMVFCGSALLLLAAAFAACYLPARRAADTDPLVALRYE
ncbi:MAG TPA: ABC transporter permease [Bryobacteraceae bacterium]|nr:ABC transporter permease [Bryobacteraceae bacterium]